LRESLKELCLILFSDTRSGIGNAYLYFIATSQPGFEFHFYEDIAFIGELGCIGQQVDYYLADANRVCSNCRQVRLDDAFHLDWLVFDKTAHGGKNAGGHIYDVHFVEGQFHLACFNFGEVEDIVDKSQQVLT